MIELLPWAMLANGPAWTNAGPPFERLEQVRLQGVLQQHGHRAGDADVLGRDGLAIRGRREDDPPEPRPEVLQVGGQRQDGHDLGADRDDELRLARDAVLATAQADDHVAQGPVADVEDARPEDPLRVDAERVLVVQAVVEERAGQVVGRPDGVDIAGQVEVEVLHRDDLAVAATGRAALDPEDRTERRLADAHGGLAADRVEPLGQADGRRGLALAERRRGDRGHDDVLAARPFRLEAPDGLERDLGLGRAVQLELGVGETEVPRDIDDRTRRDGAGDLQIGWERHQTPRLDTG